MQNIEAFVFRPLRRSLWKHFAELGVLYSSLHCIMRKDLYMKPYKATVICELSDADDENSLVVCDRLLQHFSTILKSLKVIFSDDCAVYLSSFACSVYFWSDANPHYVEEVQDNPPHVMVWAVLYACHLNGLSFF
jgi:hypothetical protein